MFGIQTDRLCIKRSRAPMHVAGACIETVLLLLLKRSRRGDWSLPPYLVSSSPAMFSYAGVRGGSRGGMPTRGTTIQNGGIDAMASAERAIAVPSARIAETLMRSTVVMHATTVPLRQVTWIDLVTWM